VVVEYRPRIALDSVIFQKAAQPVEEAVFVCIVLEYPQRLIPHAITCCKAPGASIRYLCGILAEY